MGDDYSFRDRLGFRMREDIFREKRSPKSSFCFGACPRKEPLPCFESPEFQLDTSMYKKNERKSDVDDSALDNFVHRVLLSAAVSESGNDSYGIMNTDDGHVLRPENNFQNQESPYRERKSRARKQERKGKRGKKGDMKEKKIEDYLINDDEDGSDGAIYLKIPLAEFKKYVISEVESRARIVHDFYSFHWDKVQEDRMEAFRSILVWKENFHQVESRLVRAEKDMSQLKADHDRLQTELESIKNAKRKRRKDAKIRKNKQTISSFSSETASVDESNSCHVRSE